MRQIARESIQVLLCVISVPISCILMVNLRSDCVSRFDTKQNIETHG